jgi:hypothetical protein
MVLSAGRHTRRNHQSERSYMEGREPRQSAFKTMALVRRSSARAKMCRLERPLQGAPQ